VAEHKWIVELVSSTPLADAARRALAVRLESVRQFLSAALEPSDQDVENVHQLRVSTRRARAAFDIFSDCCPDKILRAARHHLRSIRRSAGAARDWDVFFDHVQEESSGKPGRRGPGLNFVSGYALSQRTVALDRLRKLGHDHPAAIDRLIFEAVAAVHRPQGRQSPKTLGDLATPLFLDLVSDLEQSAAADLTDYRNLHQLRIAGKRLRYGIEIIAGCFAPALRDRIYPAVEEMQDILGLANDSQVARERLKELSMYVQSRAPLDWKRLGPGIEGLMRLHEQRINRERKSFQNRWRRWKKVMAETSKAICGDKNRRVDSAVPVK
jgi:CHAD domain-containing protein